MDQRNNMNKNEINFVFFGGEPLAVPVLEELKKANLLPNLIVCSPDKPFGRKQELTPPPTKVWAQKNGIETFQPTSYKAPAGLEILNKSDWDLFVVVAYNYILPKWLIEIPKKGTLNVHPSMLPKLRGASPIRTAIKDDLRDDIGVSVMLLDEEMDHGPILDQIFVPIEDENWPLTGPELDNLLAKEGGSLLTEVIPAWLNGEVFLQEQNHEAATYCGRFTKTDSELNINPKNLPGGKEAWNSWLKINAFADIGETYFIYDGKRVKIKKAELSKNGSLCLLRVIPEGKNEMEFKDYLTSIL